MDHDVADFDDFALFVFFLFRLGALGRRAAEHGLHAGQEHLGTERLGDVIVGTHVQAGHNIDLFAFGGQHDDWDRLGHRVGLQLAADAQPVEAGQHEVEDDQVRRLCVDGRQGVFARGHARHLIALLQQVVADQFPDVLFILYDQNRLLKHGNLQSGTGRYLNFRRFQAGQAARFR